MEVQKVQILIASHIDDIRQILERSLPKDLNLEIVYATSENEIVNNMKNVEIVLGNYHIRYVITTRFRRTESPWTFGV